MSEKYLTPLPEVVHIREIAKKWGVDIPYVLNFYGELPFLYGGAPEFCEPYNREEILLKVKSEIKESEGNFLELYKFIENELPKIEATMLWLRRADVLKFECIKSGSVPAKLEHLQNLPTTTLLEAPPGSVPGVPASPESTAAWFDKSMSASTWWKNESITPIHAALILCGQNPNKSKGKDAAMIEAAEETTSGGIGPDDFQALKNTFDGASNEKRRTLKDWMEYAQEHDLTIHSWLGVWIEASGVMRAPLAVTTPQAAPAIELVTSANLLTVLRPQKVVESITKNQILIAFNELVKDINLSKAMADGAKWAVRARVSKGARGRDLSTWNPLLMAVELCERGLATKAAINRAFFKHQFLAGWREQWHEHSEGI